MAVIATTLVLIHKRLRIQQHRELREYYYQQIRSGYAPSLLVVIPDLRTSLRQSMFALHRRATSRPEIDQKYMYRERWALSPKPIRKILMRPCVMHDIITGNEVGGVNFLLAFGKGMSPFDKLLYTSTSEIFTWYAQFDSALNQLSLPRCACHSL